MLRMVCAVLSASAANAVILPAPVLAADWLDDVYVGARLSVNDSDENNLVFDETLGGAIFVGKPVWKGFRIEAELSRREPDIEKISVATVNGQLNATGAILMVYYDFRKPEKELRPFVGFGAGAAKLSASAKGARGGEPITLHTSNTKRAIQGAVGLSWRLHPKMALELAAVYFETENKIFNGDFGNNTAFEGFYRSYGGSLGFRRAF
ncbi:MAG: hypothetical protein Tsb0010_09450 [Parvularculaceae bacterium]